MAWIPTKRVHHLGGGTKMLLGGELRTLLWRGLMCTEHHTGVTYTGVSLTSCIQEVSLPTYSHQYCSGGWIPTKGVHHWGKEQNRPWEGSLTSPSYYEDRSARSPTLVHYKRGVSKTSRLREVSLKARG